MSEYSVFVEHRAFKVSIGSVSLVLFLRICISFLTAYCQLEVDVLKSPVILVDLSVSYNFVRLALYILRCIQISNCRIFLHILTFYPYEVITFILSGSPYVKICLSRVTLFCTCVPLFLASSIC